MVEEDPLLDRAGTHLAVFAEVNRGLREAVGSMGDWLRKLANGIDERPVVAHHDPKSSGSENTYPEDLTDLETIRHEIDEMSRHAVAWLERRQLFARTVTIKVRYSDFTTITRSHTAPATREGPALSARAVLLLEKTEAGRRPVRLLGVSVHNLCTVTTPDTECRDWLPFVD